MENEVLEPVVLARYLSLNPLSF